MPDPIDTDRIRTDALAIAATYEKATDKAMLGCFAFVAVGTIGAAFAAGYSADVWWQKILHGIGFCFLGGVALLSLYAWHDVRAKRQATDRFRARFPEDGPEWDEAMSVLAGFSDEDLAERTLFDALGGAAQDYDGRRSAPAEAALESALDQLEPPDAWPPEPPATEEEPRSPPTWGRGVIPLRPEPPESENEG